MINACGRWDAALSPRGMLFYLLALLTAVIALAVLARVEPEWGLALSGCLLVGTALLLPRLGVALLVLLTPIQGLLGLSRQDMPLLLAALLMAVNLRHLAVWRQFLADWRQGSLPSMMKILGLFIILYSLRGLVALPDMDDPQMRFAEREVSFLILLFGAALATRRHCMNGNGDGMRLGLIGAIGLSLGLTLLFDGVAVYLPVLSRDLDLLPSWQGIRLSGLHANPNATAKFLIAGLAFSLAGVWRFGGFDGEPRPVLDRRWMLLLLLAAIACALGIGATLSKASLLGALVALGLLSGLFWLVRRRRAALVVFLSAVGFLGLVLGFDAALALGIGEWVHHQRFEAEHIVPPASPSPSRQEAPIPRKPDLATRIGKELRLAQSYDMKVVKPPPKPDSPRSEPVKLHSEMYRNIDGTIEYKERGCGLGCTGQRDRLWRTGLQVVSEHWLLGIGPAAWPVEFQKRLQFPFDTPHNALLEMGGGFGLAGLMVYFALTVAVLRLLWQVFVQSFDTVVAAIHARGTMLFALSIMATEWLDPGKFLTMNPHALWLWPLMAGLTPAFKPSGLAVKEALKPL